MHVNRRLLLCLTVLAAAAIAALWPARSLAFVEIPYTLGKVINDSTNILIIRVEKVNKENNQIIFRKVEDIKGKHPTDVIKHNIGKARLMNDREWSVTMQWAEVGKTAVMFHNGGASETCIGVYWHQAYNGGEWWNQSHGEPYLLRSYCGNIDKLIAAVKEIVAGREVVVPCMVDGDKNALHMGTAKIQRMKASLKLQDYNPKRDFVGWGGEDFRRIQGMPGFTHYSALTRVDPEALSISAVDFDGDGKPDLCLVGAGRIGLFQNGGESFNEVGLPNASGARAAVWADYNGDGLPDLLLATPTGPKLYTNLGKNQFRDDSHLLPKEPGYNLTAAVWIDYDGDGKPDILLGNGFHGLRLYRNVGAVANPTPIAPPQPNQPPPPLMTWTFEDVSVKLGFGPDGIGGTVKGDTLTVCDVNGDGRPDILYGAGTGLLILNTPEGFKESRSSGISYRPGKIGPVFGDFDNSGAMSLFVPQLDGQCKLFKNDGQGHFQDITARTGDLAKPMGMATCAAWGDIDNDGHLDLVVGCLRGPNRFFRNRGDGTFEDATEKIGLHQKIFNTQGVCLVDLNKDGQLDMVFNNEGQDSCILLGNPALPRTNTPVTLALHGKSGVVGSKVRVLDKDGKMVATHSVSGGDGRGGQQAPSARFALKPGTYKVEVRYSSGKMHTESLTVAGSPMHTAIEEK
jgi:hypothetical protein